MSAIDDGFRVIMARARAREFAMKKAMGDANVTDMKSTLKKYEDEFYATSLMLKVTLTSIRILF